MIRVEPQVKDGARYNQKEAAKILRISTRTLYEMETNGIIQPGIRFGREKIYTGSVLKKCFRNYMKMQG